jgi:hypothetical protein
VARDKDLKLEHAEASHKWGRRCVLKKKFSFFVFVSFFSKEVNKGFYFIYRGLVKFMNFLVKLHEVCRVSRW